MISLWVSHSSAYLTLPLRRLIPPVNLTLTKLGLLVHCEVRFVLYINAENKAWSVFQRNENEKWKKNIVIISDACLHLNSIRLSA